MTFLTSRTALAAATLLLCLGVALLLHAESEFVVGAIVALSVAAWFAAERSGAAKMLASGAADNPGYTRALGLAGLGAVALYLHDDHFNLLMMTTVLVHVIACLGLNIQFGYAGLLNFAGAAFFGAGAYTAAVLTGTTGMPHGLVLLAGGVVAVLLGLVIMLPVLRTRGHYAAVVTIAFSLLFRSLVEVNQTLGGAQGAPVAGLNLFGWDFTRNLSIAGFEMSFYMNYFVLALALTIAAVAVSRAIERSWIGLNLDTIRLDETAAACFGLNVARWKMTAFAIGNFILGVAGAFHATMLGFIAPENFTFGDSLIMVSIILLGGIGSMPGIAVAAAIVVILPEKLQAIQEYRYLIFAVGTIVVLLFRPNGLVRRPLRDFLADSTRGTRHV